MKRLMETVMHIYLLTDEHNHIALARPVSNPKFFYRRFDRTCLLELSM